MAQIEQAEALVGIRELPSTYNPVFGSSQEPVSSSSPKEPLKVGSLPIRSKKPLVGPNRPYKSLMGFVGEPTPPSPITAPQAPVRYRIVVAA